MCPMCQLAEKQKPSDRRCAFDAEGHFHSDNRNCATMHALRIQAFFAVSVKLRDEDVFARGVLMGHDGAFVELFWRDESQSTDHAVILRTDGAFHVEPLTLQFAKELLEARARKGL